MDQETAWQAGYLNHSRKWTRTATPPPDGIQLATVRNVPHPASPGMNPSYSNSPPSNTASTSSNNTSSGHQSKSRRTVKPSATASSRTNSTPTTVDGWSPFSATTLWTFDTDPAYRTQSQMASAGCGETENDLKQMAQLGQFYQIGRRRKAYRTTSWLYWTPQTPWNIHY